MLPDTVLPDKGFPIFRPGRPSPGLWCTLPPRPHLSRPPKTSCVLCMMLTTQAGPLCSGLAPPPFAH